jgi:hypothetical protein
MKSSNMNTNRLESNIIIIVINIERGLGKAIGLLYVGADHKGSLNNDENKLELKVLTIDS